MSRNLGRTNCYYCSSDVVLTGPPHRVTAADCGRYLDEYGGMIVAQAECPACLAQYLAWIRDIPYRCNNEEPINDLSLRSSFNDEPNDRDLPRYEVRTQFVRVGPFLDTANLRLGPVPERT